MNVIVAEDDRALSQFLRKALEVDGHTVECFGDGLAALDHVGQCTPDLLILDLGLPRMDGVDVLRALEKWEEAMSVMVLTGRSGLTERIECLNLGADDYLVKPFSMHELLARCRAISRRRSGNRSGLLRHGDLTMDRITRSVSFAGEKIDFTAKEFMLLEYLLLQRGRAVTRKELLEGVWHMPDSTGTNVVDVYVNYLRRKLSVAGAMHLIETVRGEGYAIGAERKVAQPGLLHSAASMGSNRTYIPSLGAA